MTQSTCRTIIIAFIICTSIPAWSQQYLLYSPQPVTSDQKTTSQEDILVQEIEIQKGDTLYALSRKFSGHGQYFPQILLFNSIKNPNLIYTGKVLKVPVNKKDAHSSERKTSKPASSTRKPKTGSISKTSHKAVEQQSTASKPDSASSYSGSKSVEPVINVENHYKRKTNVPENSISNMPPSVSPQTNVNLNVTAVAPTAKDLSGQKLFEAAAKAYRKDDCQSALELLDLYLKDNSSSPLAADANLYKADCYLKLSAQ